jgi:hypothetical protein
VRPDRFFDAGKQQRLQELMERWRIVRTGNRTLSSAEEIELKSLVDEEVRAAGLRVGALVRELPTPPRP